MCKLTHWLRNYLFWVIGLSKPDKQIQPNKTHEPNETTENSNSMFWDVGALRQCTVKWVFFGCFLVFSAFSLSVLWVIAGCRTVSPNEYTCPPFTPLGPNHHFLYYLKTFICPMVIFTNKLFLRYPFFKRQIYLEAANFEKQLTQGAKVQNPQKPSWFLISVKL